MLNGGIYFHRELHESAVTESLKVRMNGFEVQITPDPILAFVISGLQNIINTSVWI